MGVAWVHGGVWVLHGCMEGCGCCMGAWRGVGVAWVHGGVCGWGVIYMGGVVWVGGGVHVCGVAWVEVCMWMELEVRGVCLVEVCGCCMGGGVCGWGVNYMGGGVWMEVAWVQGRVCAGVRGGCMDGVRGHGGCMGGGCVCAWGVA